MSSLIVAEPLLADAGVPDVVKSSDEGAVQITSVSVPSVSPSVSSNSDAEAQIATSEQIPRTTMDSTEAKVLEVLHVLQTYGVAFERANHWEGLESFIPTVKKQVEAGEPVRLLLPGFPFKSPNAKDKVLGALPDFGEELALSHLNGLCDNIARVYEHGAEVHICSDGLVYNGMLVWTCEELRR
jgi:hypothetical protein